MRNTAPATFAIALVIVALATGFTFGADGKPEKVFHAGAFAQDITPPAFPISVNGGMRDRQAKAAHDPLHARCIVLDDGRTKLAIVVVDSCMVPRHVFDEAKAIASRATGIPTSHMMMSATHTHTAPTLTPVFQSPPDYDYCRFVAEKIAAGVVRAHAQREPAKIGWAVGLDPTQVFNRRWLLRGDNVMPDPFGRDRDRVKMNPGFGRHTVMRPAGPTDPEVPIVAIRAVDGDRPIALLANYSLHYVGRVPGGTVSADYFGQFAKQLTQRIDGTAKADPPFMAAMTNGTSGDINNIDYSKPGYGRKEPFAQIEHVAESVATAALAALTRVDYRDHVTLAAAEREVSLGVRKPPADEVERAEAILADAAKRGPVLRSLSEIYAYETVNIAHYPDTVDVKLQAFRIGDLAVCAIPCEVFVDIGIELKERSPIQPTFTISLANGYNGYLPTPEQHTLGGYETWRARSSYLAEDSSPKVVSTLLELLAELGDQKSR